MALYSLARADRSVKLAAVLFQLILGYSYVFAFLMVWSYAGLTPGRVADTYVPRPPLEDTQLSQQSHATDQPMTMAQMEHMTLMSEMQHTVDTNLLIQDSHIHIMIYAFAAAFQTLLVLGLGWGSFFRDSVIVAAFAFGALDFAGQWLMKAGIGGFAWLTLASGWGMAAVYLIVLYGTLRAVLAGTRKSEL